MNLCLSRLLLAGALVGALAVTSTTPLAARMQNVQRYPREANADGSFRCYADGCPLFGLCCS
jgi:hypothetical protein